MLLYLSKILTQVSFAPILCAVHCSIVPLAITLLSALSMQVPSSADKITHHQHCQLHDVEGGSSAAAAPSWMQIKYLLPFSLSLGWAAQAYLFHRDRSARRLFVASLGLSLLSAKTLSTTNVHSWQLFMRDHSTSVNLIGSALLIGSSFVRSPVMVRTGKITASCCKKNSELRKKD